MAGKSSQLEHQCDASLGCGADLARPGLLNKHVLWLVIALNFTMFLVEVTAGLIAGSIALLADALDFISDTASYSIALYVLNKPLKWRAGAALLKGAMMLVFGIWVLYMAITAMLGLHQPEPLTMGIVGALAFTVNVISAFLVFRFAKGDSNLRSVWICSRNDAVANLAVIVAASGVFALNTGWPDIIVALIIATLALWGASQIITHAMGELRPQKPHL